MWTLQILDGAESWLHPLDGTAVTVGSGEGCGLRLEAAGLEPLHAKIERLQDGTLSLRAMDGAEVRCNGESVLRTPLSLGDRIELGAAKLVVGQRVERDANELDVLSRTVRSRGGSDVAGANRRAAWMVVGGVALLLGFAWLYWVQTTDDQVPVDYAKADVARRDGRFEVARELIGGLHTGWAAERATRQQKVAILEQRLAATESAVAAKRVEIVDRFTSYRDALAALRHEETDGATQHEREVAMIVRSGLREAFLAGEASREADSGFRGLAAEGGIAARPATPGGGAEPFVVTEPPGHPADADPTTTVAVTAAKGGQSPSWSVNVEAAQEASMHAAEQGEWRVALEHQRSALDHSNAGERAAVYAKLLALKRRVRDVSGELVLSAQTLADAGELNAAVQSLRTAAPRFPTVGELASVAAALRELESNLTAQHSAAQPTKLTPSAVSGAVSGAVNGAVDPAGGARSGDEAEAPAPRELSAALAKRIRRGVPLAFKQEPVARNRFLSEILGEGEQAATLLHEQLREAYKREVARVKRAPALRELGELFEAREELEVARKRALALIFDTQAYFTPYKTPAVTAQRAAEYRVVQRDVDARVAAVQGLWDHPKQITIPKNLAARVDVLGWLTETLIEFGDGAEEGRELLDRLALLPSGAREVGIRDLARSAAEARRLELHAKLRVLSVKRATVLSQSSKKLAVLTNDYRSMMGLRPLVLDPRLVVAADLHAEDMATRNYFGHHSPGPDSTSPAHRMGAQGYDLPSGENIAQGRDPAGSHFLWLQSAGHHRNILTMSHTELGLGVQGRYVVQVFGRGTDHLDDPRLGDG